jgi:phenylpropionate dioxygenase-like ring-hydroxylating dioxygenase large terminal subunit
MTWNVIDNFLECYHCHVAHREFVALVDMETYEVRTHGIWSSHFAEAGKGENPAYDVAGASVTQHAVWWLWPNTCLLRYPGRGNFMVFQVVPAGPDRTLETWDFFFETDRLRDAEVEAVRYIDEVLQMQDIAIVESVQRGMATPAFDQGRIVYDPGGAGVVGARRAPFPRSGAGGLRGVGGCRAGVSRRGQGEVGQRVPAAAWVRAAREESHRGGRGADRQVR